MPKISSISQYDAFIKYQKGNQSHKTILEFKFNANDIIKDIKDNRKDYTKIDVLVSWTINIQDFKKENYDIIEVDKEETVFYTGTTHYIKMADMPKISLICLEVFIQKLKTKK